MAYDYPFDIFKLSFPNKFKSGCGTILVSHVDEKDKRTNNDLQNITHKTKDRVVLH
jgi:hypothetical protein